MPRSGHRGACGIPVAHRAAVVGVCWTVRRGHERAGSGHCNPVRSRDAGEPCVRDLHLGSTGMTEGGDGHARQRVPLRARDAAALGVTNNDR